MRLKSKTTTLKQFWKMKKFTLTTAVLGIVLSTASFASTGKDAKDVSVEKKDEKVELTYLSEGEAKVKVNIYNQRGAIVYSEVIKHPKSFSKSYDLSKLPKGEYEFEIVDSRKVVSEKVTLSSAKNAEKFLKADVSMTEEGKYSLVVIGEVVKPIQVNIYNARGILLYGDYISVEKSFTRSYDLTKSHVKDVKFEVIQDGTLLAEAKF